MLDYVRVALIKAIIVRNMRLENLLPQEDYLVNSDPDDPNTARRLGRLFAVIERAQLAALGDQINATIKDKFLGAAAATPQQVFVGLLKNVQHHTRRLRNGHSDADWIKDAEHARRVGASLDRDIGLLWGAFKDGAPRQHSVEEQGLFFVGYYQEKYSKMSSAKAGANSEIETDNLESQQ